jgi:YihY family inner membrane protein
MMGSIRVAFRGVWDSEARRPYLRGKGRDVVLVLGAGLLVVSAFALSVVVQVVTEAGLEVAERLGRDASATAPLGTIAQVAAATGLSALAFLLLYRVAAPLEVRVRDALPAAILAGVGAQVASAGFSLYLRYFADFDDVYGPLGAVLALLLLVYVQRRCSLPAPASPRPGRKPADSLRRAVVRDDGIAQKIVGAPPDPSHGGAPSDERHD